MLRDSTLLAASPSGLSRGSRNAMVKGEVASMDPWDKPKDDAWGLHAPQVARSAVGAF